MAGLLGVATAVPDFVCTLEDARLAGKAWLCHDSPQLMRFEKFIDASQTRRRHFVQPINALLAQGGMKSRAEIFESAGLALSLQSAERVFRESRIEPEKIDTFIFTSCSAPVIPSIDTELVRFLNLRPNVRRIPIYQHGCAAGVVGLSLASKFAESGDTVLITSTELCSLGFYPADRESAHLVGSAIFADGSASALIGPDGGRLRFLDSLSVLTKNSRHLMGYDLLDDGAHLRLDKSLPGFLAGELKEIVLPFLNRNSLHTEDISWWLLHPGGQRILGCIEELFAIDPSQAVWARTVLENYGNTSSASILFVTSEFLKSGVAASGDFALMLGVGPGLTVELILFCVSS